MKKIASLTALLFFLAAPLAYAYDFGTAGIVAAVGGAGAALALVFGAPAALGTVAIGSLVAGLQFAAPDPSAGQTPQVEVQLSPGAKLKTPAGWTDPSAGQTDPTPPSTVPPESGYRCPYSTAACFPVKIRKTVEEAAQDTLAYLQTETGSNAPWTFHGCNVNGSPNNCLFKDKTGYSSVFTMFTGVGCPTGYYLDGSICRLNDPQIVPKPPDDKCTIKRTGNTFTADPLDPDCATGKIPASVAVSPNTISMTGPDGSTKSVTINSDGSSTAQESRPNNSNNTTETNTTTFSAPDASGAVKVTGQGSGVAPGTGTQAGTSTAPVNVNFDKSGLATEGTLGGIRSDTSAIKDALSAKDVDSSLGDQKSALDTAMDGLAALFGAEPSKSAVIEDDFSIGGFLPAQCGCSPLTMTILGKTASYNWCGPMETFKGVFSWVIGLLTALYVLSLFRLGGGK